jgi:stage III sporulation protein AB
MKIAGIVILIAACTLLGLNKTAKLRKRVGLLTETEKYISFFQTQLRYNQYPPEEILKKYTLFSRHKVFSSCKAKLSGNVTTFTCAWREAFDEAAAGCALSAEDRRLIAEFGEGLGTTDIEGQLEHCSLYSEYMKARQADAQQELAKKGRLFIVLGVTSGLSAALLAL